MVRKKELRGYNPAKRGRASHHPLMTFVADTRMIANCWLRPGNSSSANNVQAFLANTLHRLGDKRVSLLRADSGFSDSAFLDYLDQQQLHHITALRQNQPLQHALVNAEDWWVLQDDKGKPVEGIELTRFAYQAPYLVKTPLGDWGTPAYRARAAAKGKTLNLFADDPGDRQVAIFGTGDGSGFARSGHLAHLPGTCRLRKSHQGAQV